MDFEIIDLQTWVSDIYPERIRLILLVLLLLFGVMSWNIHKLPWKWNIWDACSVSEDKWGAGDNNCGVYM